MYFFSASGEIITNIVGGSIASLTTLLDYLIMITGSLYNSINMSAEYTPFMRILVLYLENVVLDPFMDVNAPGNPLALNGFLFP